jgi:DNA sulfur modification protein DndC
VVEKDRSLEGFVEAGFAEFGPLLDFRDWLASIRNDKDRRQARRRDGRVTITNDGTFIPGPFTLQTRSEIYERLRALEAQTGQSLISEEEVGPIHEIWAEEISLPAGARSMSVREVRKDK